MAYSNFKPLVWSKKIQMQLEKECIFQEFCNTDFQGEVGPGKQVKIIGVARPSVGTYTPGSNISAAEQPADTSIYLTIDQYKYTHFSVDDVDEAQSMEGLMAKLMEGSAKELAETRDAFIGTLSAQGTLSTSTSGNSADEAKAAVDAAFTQLWTKNVRINDKVVIEVTPWFYGYFKDKMTALYTDNVEMIKRGIVGMYNGAMVKMSNNIYNDGSDDYCMVRTNRAIAFAAGIHKTEAYRPDLQFYDAIKVLDCYGGKVVRPQELYVMRVHNS